MHPIRVAIVCLLGGLLPGVAPCATKLEVGQPISKLLEAGDVERARKPLSEARRVLELAPLDPAADAAALRSALAELRVPLGEERPADRPGR